MEKVPVTCPNCGEEFFVAHNVKKGKCPFCKILLKYEDVELGEEKEIEEKVDIKFIENIVDSISEERKVVKATHVADAAVIETIHPEMHYASIEKEVDKVIKRKKVS